MEDENLFVQRHLFSFNGIQALRISLRNNYKCTAVENSEQFCLSTFQWNLPLHHLQYTFKVLEHSAMRINN